MTPPPAEPEATAPTTQGAVRASDDRSDKPRARGGGAFSQVWRERSDRNTCENAREPQRVIRRARRRSVRLMTRWIMATDHRHGHGL